MCWIESAKSLFNVSRPEHFTNHLHCEECAEHDETLRNSSVESIGLKELGNPGWDPICFCSIEGKLYYMPALIRLCLDTLEEEFYFEQLLFHLEYDGQDNELYMGCNEDQRNFIANFVESMIENHADKIEENLCTDEALKTYEIWSHT